MSWISAVETMNGNRPRRTRVRKLAAVAALVALGAFGWRLTSIERPVHNRSQSADATQQRHPEATVTCVAWPASSTVQLPRRVDDIRLCQGVAPASPAPPESVGVGPVGPAGSYFDGACGPCGPYGGYGPFPPCVPFQYGYWGEYVDHPRLAHVPVYRLRVDDHIRAVYRLSRNEQTKPYELNVGDEVMVESFSDEKLNRSVIVQPDGSITLRLLGQFKAGRLTVAQLQENLEKSYGKFYKTPSITVTPIHVNTKLQDLINTVDARAGTGGQGIDVRVTPDGTISLPAIGPVPVQGMTLDDLRREINARYAIDIEGLDVTPILVDRAPRFVYVLGEVHLPGRFVLEGPTTVMQALSMAGSWNVGANIKQIVIFRRGDDWRLMATMVNLHAALGGKNPCPAGEIWLGDSDVVLVPKSEILKTDDFINLAFTRGLYGVIPFTSSYTLTRVGVLH
jgi:polysaccharide export outer membrane protein